MKKSQNNKTGKFIILILVIILFSVTSCGGDGENISAALNCGTTTWPKQIEKELNAFINAASDFSINDTKENCEKYKKAGLDYLKAFDNVRKCVPGGSINNFNEALQDAKKEINAINCS